MTTPATPADALPDAAAPPTDLACPLCGYSLPVLATQVIVVLAVGLTLLWTVRLT